MSAYKDKPSVVELKGIEFAYGDVPVLTQADLAVKQGEYIGLIGPNGGGKTTLLRILMGFLQPSAGQTLIYGESPRRARWRIGYVPQALQYDRLFPLTVLELVLSGRLAKTRWWGPYRSADKRKALEVLAQVGLEKQAKVPFGRLSGGQAQRALIARALVAEPDILLLDEPTANVDIEAEAEIFSLIHSLRGSLTILMVTHDLKVVIDEVDRVAIVQRSIKSIAPEKVCEHFTVGLYHRPLMDHPREKQE